MVELGDSPDLAGSDIPREDPVGATPKCEERDAPVVQPVDHSTTSPRLEAWERQRRDALAASRVDDNQRIPFSLQLQAAACLHDSRACDQFAPNEATPVPAGYLADCNRDICKGGAVDRAELSNIAHTRHPIAAPICAARAASLLARLPLPPGGRLVDLGCGQGEWLLLLLAVRPDLTAVGVDTSEPALTTARQQASARGLSERICWEQADAACWSSAVRYDAAICIGASHALGGPRTSLDAIRNHTKPGAHALFGDSFWECPPTQAALAALEANPDDLRDLAGLVDDVVAAGWEPISGHTSTAEEWDDYEWAWTGSLTEWSLRRPSEDGAVQARNAAAEHRAQWLSGYRGQLGFVTLLLADATAD